MRRRAHGLVLIVLLALLRPAAAEVRLQARCGLGGKARLDGLMQVRVELQNSSPAVRAELVAVTPAVRYRTPIELPESSHKVCTLYLPHDCATVQLVQGAGAATALSLTGVDLVEPQQTFVVVVGGDAGALSFLSSRSPAGGGLNVAQIGWQELPEGWQGWDGVDAVVLGDGNLAAASPQGVATLVRWVQAGGHLIVPGGQTGATLAGSQLAPLLPLQVSGTQVVADGLLPLGHWLGSPAPAGPALLLTATPLPQAVLRTPPGQGLIYERAAGAGSVTMAVFDTTTAPLKYWSGQTALWQRLLSRAGRRPSGPGGALLAMVSTFAEQRLPSPWLALTFLSVYLLVLAPGQYLVLRRLDRRELAWATTPLVIAVFTLCGVAMGLGPHRRLPVLQRACVVQTASGATAGVGEAAVALYSPRTRTYALKCSEEVGAITFPGPSPAADSVPRREVVYGAGVQVRNLRLKTGTTVSFAGRLLVPLGAGLTVQSARRELDGTVRLKVSNGTPFTIRAFYTRAPMLLQAPGLRPGQTAELSFSPPDQPAAHAPRARRGLSSGDPGSDLPLDQRSLALAEQLARDSSLVAVTADPLAGMALDARASVHDLSALALPVDYTLAAPAGLVTIPDWMISARVAAPPGGWKQNDLQLPVRGGVARASSIILRFSGGVGSLRRGTSSQVECFNFATRTWVRVVGTGGAVAPLPAAEYLSRDGVISMRTNFTASFRSGDPALADGYPTRGHGGMPPAMQFSPPGGPPAGPQATFRVEVTVEPAGGERL